ncbi:DUF2971 domain-containing protein [Rhodoplanes serenus]|uniref:DUF2971 domain-containing protein n=1 Tax=Rhodoplanes serenus TaxID=200615 RepID=UPI0011B949BF|nr:DUF2971 domain-containing protein [Rhodoplanes serenus]
MLIYKFMASETHFFEGGNLRFSQPPALKDPDEAKPEFCFESHTQQDLDTARKYAESQGMIDLADSDLRRIFLRPFPNVRYDETYFPALWPRTEKRLRSKPFRTLQEYDQALVERAVALCRDYVDKSVGILSLTQDSNEKFWQDWCKNNTGVRLGFFAEHEFFKDLKKIEYSNDFVFVSISDGIVRMGGLEISQDDILNQKIFTFPEALLFRKKEAFKVEAEWRMVKKLSAAISHSSAAGCTVFLFAVPPSALCSVCFDYRAQQSQIDYVCKRISEVPGWSHVTVSKRVNPRVGPVFEERLR